MTAKRTTKSIASRIQLDYLKRFQPLKYWKRLTIISVLCLTALWAFFELSPGRKKVYMTGPVAQGHKLFEKNCSECHVKSFDAVPNEACLKCHNDLGHHQEKALTMPRCAECHVEHRATHLVQTVTSANCASCHVDLRRKDGKETPYAKNISSVGKGHPEFRFLDPSQKESQWIQANIKLNHKVHLRPDLEKEDGSRVTLQCQDCHTVDTKTDPKGLLRNAAFNYEAQCRSCHALGFDTQFPKIAAPHKKPEVVREFLEGFYQERLAENPEAYLAVRDRDRPGPKGQRETYASGEEWKKSKVAAAEKDLLGRSCLECHTWKYELGALPEVAPVKLQKQALLLGRFDHAAHRGMDCLQCHTQAAGSEKTSDQLIPGIQNCLKCHTQEGPGRESCFECHRYHGEGSSKKF